MDIRQTRLGILCGGTPAPGVNAVLAALTQECLQENIEVIGFLEGFKRLRTGNSLIEKLDRQRVSQIQYTGGSILRVSKKQIEDEKHADNALRVLEHHRIRYLVTIGGVKTAYSSHWIAKAATKAKYKLSVVHIPKTIFNDLPLPDDVATFGFDTAVSVGSSIIRNLDTDARTMLRWYIVTVVGAVTGHLALAIGKSASSALTLIPEDFIDQLKEEGRKLTFKEICDLVEVCIIKRRIWNREYGTVVLSEGLIDLMAADEVKERFKDADIGHQDLGRSVALELRKRFENRKIEMYVWWHNIGNECRAAPPSARDMEACRDLGFGAVRYLLHGGTGVMLTIKGGSLYPIQFEDIIDPEHFSTKIRFVDKNKLAYLVAQAYMVKLRKKELTDPSSLNKLARAANCSPAEFEAAFKGVALDSKDFSSIFTMPRSDSRHDLQKLTLRGIESKLNVMDRDNSLADKEPASAVGSRYTASRIVAAPVSTVDTSDTTATITTVKSSSSAASQSSDHKSEADDSAMV